MISIIIFTCIQATPLFKMTDVTSLIRPVPPEEANENVKGYTEEASSLSNKRVDGSLPDFLFNYEALRHPVFDEKPITADRKGYNTRSTWTQTMIVTCHLFGSLVLFGLVIKTILEKDKGKPLQVVT